MAVCQGVSQTTKLILSNVISCGDVFIFAALLPHSQCERNPCPMNSRSCHLAPKTVSFHYLSLPSNPKTPATLFRMATAAAPGRTGPDSLRFGIVGGNSRGMFVMQRSDRQTGELILVQSLRGPQEISVDVDMSEYSDRTFQAKHVAKVHVLVSPYAFWERAHKRRRPETGRVWSSRWLYWCGLFIRKRFFLWPTYQKEVECKQILSCHITIKAFGWTHYRCLP